MKIYRSSKKYEVVQWNGENLEEIKRFCMKFDKTEYVRFKNDLLRTNIYGDINIGDYFVREYLETKFEVYQKNYFEGNFEECES